MRSDFALSFAMIVGAALAPVVGASGVGAKEVYTVVHQFVGAPDDGAYSYADVAVDHAGNLYGTTHNGGAHDVGSIYKIAPGGAETILHSFALGDDNGYNPYGGVTVDEVTGDLYGTTEFGGTSDAGVIWKLTSDGTFSVLHDFDDANDGRQPRWHLVRDRAGDFFGVALYGGAGGDGTVFELTADGAFKILHSFSGADGNNPVGRLYRDHDGDLYGVTFLGGAHNWGSVYKIDRHGSFSTLYSFTEGADGGFPEGGLQQDKDGNLFGTTASGGDGYGTLFKLASDGTLSTLYTFADGKDGGAPFGDLLRTSSGKIYGTTSMSSVGDCQNGCGTVFEFTPGGKLKTLHRFAGGADDGGQADAGLTRGDDGSLYGAVPYYGVAGDGVVFRIGKK